MPIFTTHFSLIVYISVPFSLLAHISVSSYLSLFSLLLSLTLPCCLSYSSFLPLISYYLSLPFSRTLSFQRHVVLFSDNSSGKEKDVVLFSLKEWKTWSHLTVFPVPSVNGVKCRCFKTDRTI